MAFGNLLQGVPFELNELMMSQYHGGFFGLLNPFALVCGLVSVSMFVLQGSTWLQMKTTGDVYNRAPYCFYHYRLIGRSTFCYRAVSRVQKHRWLCC